MILPFAKLGTLALRTLSKPLAARVKTQAARHPRFRASIASVAQFNHRFQVNIQRRIYGHATDVEIRPLNEDKAVQAASDLLGEVVVFSVGVGVVIFEVQRSAKGEARKEEARKAEFEELRQKIAELTQRVQSMETPSKGSNDYSSVWTPFRKGQTEQSQISAPQYKLKTASYSNPPNLAPTASPS